MSAAELLALFLHFLSLSVFATGGAMALASDPKVLLLDEPMAGVSAEDVDGLTEIIGEVRDSGVAVAMVEHHMHVVLGLADRVAVLHHGQLLASGSPQQVTADERVQQAYLGEAL